MPRNLGLAILILMAAAVGAILWVAAASPGGSGGGAGPNAIPPAAVQNQPGIAPGVRQGDPVAAAPRQSDAPPFREYFIGKSLQAGMEVQAVYLPPIAMDMGTMEGHGQGPAPAAPSLDDPDVIHLECDLRATEGNPNGFADGEWVPYCRVDYVLAPAAGGKEERGTMMAMVARDGPHYGVTLKMPGAGSYRLQYTVHPPSVNGFGRHTDAATGVGEWWKPFTVTFDFAYPVAKTIGGGAE